MLGGSGGALILTGAGGSGGSSSVPQLGCVYAAKFGVTANGRFVYDAVSNGTTTITSATANFTSADIGKIVFGVDSSGNATSPPQGIVVSINSPTSIIVSNTATTSHTGITLGIGTDDTTACANAWAAAVAAAQYLILPSGQLFVQAPLFNLISGITSRNLGLLSSGFSTLCPTPNFNFSAAPYPTSGLFFEVVTPNEQVFPNNSIISDIGVFGAGQLLSGNSNTNSVFLFEQCQVNNVWVWFWGQSASQLIAVTASNVTNLNGLFVYHACSLGLLVLGNAGQFVTIQNGSYVFGMPRAVVIESGGQLISTGSEWGSGGTSPGVNVQAGGIFNSEADTFEGISTTGDLLDVSGVAYVTQANFIGNDTAVGLNVLSGGQCFLSGSIFDLTVGGAIAVQVNSAGVFVDDGTNSSTAGTMPGMAAANITPSTGWGASGAAGNGVSAVSGDARRFQFTITSAGSPTPNPTIALVFPWTLPRVPIVLCQQVGGTGAIEPVTISSAATTTGVTLTWNGTPGEPKTFIFNVILE